MLVFLVLEIKGAKNDKIFNFFKRLFLGNGWPYGYDFWRVLRDHCEVSQKYNFAIFLNI